MSKVRDFAEIISTGVASTDVSGLTTAITNEFTSIEYISPSYIRTTLLYPAVSGNISNGTAHSGTYGDTVQTDGHKYYYTDIKGSKPIKDPRIGAHFGSQRHGFKSIQLLEQETATHGDKVYSIDGREWMRVVGDIDYVNGTGSIYVKIESATSSFFEITGYFNAFNFINYTSDTNRSFKVEIDGVTAHTGFNPNSIVNSPLGVRYVSSGSVFNVDLTSSSSLSSDTTLGIHTLRISYASGYPNYPTGCELIVQDTTDTASKSKIQIPAQTVVSFNKQHSVSATAQHYDPFNGFVNSTSLHSAFVDTATSLGLSTPIALHGAPWAISGSNNIRPYNGGRVVKWVDSSGTIKTSVNMMPANAQTQTRTAAAEITTPSATNTAYLPAFSDDVIDYSLAEVAKTFHVREFGNGAANGGKGAAYADVSMLEYSQVDNIAYVMDDGLTSLTAYWVGWYSATGLRRYQGDGREYWYITFIGTGIEIGGSPDTGTTLRKNTVAQNLPYGTHILWWDFVTPDGNANVYIDGVLAWVLPTTDHGYGIWDDVTIFQPKMPPIPEDACVIADYMLMADFVKTSSGNQGHISKGVRYLSSSRDVFYDQTSNITSGAGWGSTITQDVVYPQGYTTQGQGAGISAGSASLEVPYFGTDVGMTGYTGRTGTTHTESINSTSVSSSFINSSRESRVDVTGQTLQLNGFKSTWTTSEMFIASIELAIPIHTSLHYQSFETPFLHELVGGDRNMEQTNLVVTPDGKTWDDVTRDTSYIGPKVFEATTDTDHTWANIIIFDTYRGTSGHYVDYYNKDFAIAYDRHICLKEGQYRIHFQTPTSAGGDHNLALRIIGKTDWTLYPVTASVIGFLSATRDLYLKRGDALQMVGMWGYVESEVHQQYSITRL